MCMATGEISYKKIYVLITGHRQKLLFKEADNEVSGKQERSEAPWRFACNEQVARKRTTLP